MWLSGLSVVPCTERSPVPFPARAHAGVVGSASGAGVQEAAGCCFFLTDVSLSPSLPLSLKNQ